MSDDALLDFLHMELVNRINSFELNGDNEKNDAMSKLEQIGFSTGYRFIERWYIIIFLSVLLNKLNVSG